MNPPIYAAIKVVVVFRTNMLEPKYHVAWPFPLMYDFPFPIQFPTSSVPRCDILIQSKHPFLRPALSKDFFVKSRPAVS
ncbi:hypothetical protein ACTXT7_011676 [Hymenolepis weldensis]